MKKRQYPSGHNKRKEKKIREENAAKSSHRLSSWLSSSSSSPKLLDQASGSTDNIDYEGKEKCYIKAVM